MSQQLALQGEVALPVEIAQHPTAVPALTSADQVIAAAESINITTLDEYNGGAEVIQKIAGAIKKLEVERLSITAPMDAATKRVTDWFNGPLSKLESAKATLRRKMIEFTNAQEEIRKKAQREAEERARKEREEREYLAAEERRKAEQERRHIESEQQRAREEEQAALRAAQDATDETQRKEAESAARRARLESMRLSNQSAIATQASEATIAQIQTFEPVAQVPVAEAPKAKGISQRQVAKYEIVDPNKINDAFWVLDEKAIGKMVSAMGLKATTVVGEGIKVWMENDISVRAK